MRKEVILAIVIGLILGSILVFGLQRANQAIVPDQPGQTTASPTPSPTPISMLTIKQPQDGQIFSQNTATVSGQTQPDNVLVIISENSQLTPKLDQNGRFQQTIELVAGGNLIQVSAISPSGQRQDKFLNLVFTTQLD